MSSAPRLQDWPTRLAAYVESRRFVAFAWGEQDCCQFARGAVAAVTGLDPAVDWGLRPYRSGRGATAQLARLGGLEAIPARAGCAEIPLLAAGRGDLALGLSTGDGRPALGVVLGRQVAFVGKQGLEFLETSACARAWRVG